MPKQAVVLGAGGGARAVVYGLISRGLPADHRVQPAPPSGRGAGQALRSEAAHMELRAMPWHESIIEAEIAKTKLLVNATSIGLTNDESPVPAECLHDELLVLDLIYSRTRLLRDADAAGCDRLRRRADAAPPGRSRLHAVDRSAGAARADAAKLAEARAGGLRSAEGEPREPSPRRPAPPTDRRRPTDGRRRWALRFLTAGESHGPALGATIEGVPAGLPLTEDVSPSTWPADSVGTAAARDRRSSRTAPRSSAASATGGRSARRSSCSSATATGRTGRGSCRSSR